MALFFLEPHFDGLIWLVLGILFVGFGIPIIIAIIGGVKWQRGKKKTAKILYIIAAVYALISAGICGSLGM